MTKIEHLVISGGGHHGLSMYGLLRESNKAGFWELENIKTIYSTSVGTIVTIFISLGYPWEDLDEYLLKRPWQNVFKLDINSFINAYDNKGVFDKKIIKELIGSLLLGKGFEINTTLLELYEKTKIEIHFVVCELNNLEVIDMSYKTHPQWTIIDVVYCSSCLPILFIPLVIEDKCYIDGGILMNYPLKLCMENLGEDVDKDSIFGIKLKQSKSITIINNESSMYDYLFILLNKIFSRCSNPIQCSIKNEITIEAIPIVSVFDIVNTLSSYEQRNLLIANGAELWEKHKDLLCSGHD
jgi:predicted acylesterase/phospholipase RssA